MAAIAIAIGGGARALPFSFKVVPVLPDALSGAKHRAQAGGVNDAGHVVGVYAPPAPRTGDQVFVRLEDGRLLTREISGKRYVYASHITNTGVIGGHAQGDRSDVASFAFGYDAATGLAPLQTAWPVQDYMLSGLNDRGDAIGWNPRVLGAYESGPLGFIFVNGKLQWVEASALPTLGQFSNAVLAANGLVVGGQTYKIPGQQRERRPFRVIDGRFEDLGPLAQGTVRAVNGLGHWVSDLTEVVPGHFGLHDGTFRQIDCGRQWCVPAAINDWGWVLGVRFTDYAIPPAGASIGHAFVWIRGEFYSLDWATGVNIGQKMPLRLGQAGHIVFHDRGGRPYLLIPSEIPETLKVRAPAASPK